MIKKIKLFLFKNTSTSQTIVKNTFWLSIGQFGSRFLKAAIFIYAARTLGASGYGVFAYVLGSIGLILALSDIGINSMLTREAAKGEEKLSVEGGYAEIHPDKILIFTELLENETGGA